MTSISELQVGNTIKDSMLLGWRFVSSIPQDVAEFWLIEKFPDSVINSKGITPVNQPMKNWETGFGIVVGTMASMPQEERLILLHKLSQGFFLFESKETRPCNIEINDLKI